MPVANNSNVAQSAENERVNRSRRFDPDVFVFASESVLVSLAGWLLKGRKVGVIETQPLIPPFGFLLHAIISWLRKGGWVVDIMADRPDLVAEGNLDDFRRKHDHFATTEPWIDSHYGLADAVHRYGDYGYAYKHLVCNRAKDYPFLVHTVARINGNLSPSRPILGMRPDLIAAYEFRVGHVPESIRASRDFRIPGNLLLTILVLGYGFIWTLRRTRMRTPAPRRYFLGSDFVGDPRQRILWNELADIPEPLIVLLRNKDQEREHAGTLAAHPYCHLSDGVVPIGQLLSLFTVLLSDTVFLYRRGRHLSPSIFWELIKLPLRRIMYRGLLNRFRFECFWARDDYNVEHIIRTQEFRRAGIKHFGQMHALPAYPPVSGQRRYVYFDVYYVFGKGLHRDFYADRWPADMKVKAVGSFGMSRAQLMRLRRPRPNNIICFIKQSFQDDATFDLIHKVAQAFPDRIVYVKPKQQKGGAFRTGLDRLLGEGPKNIVETNEDSYELMFRAKYSLSDPSSLVAEAIQFGLVSFALLTVGGWRNVYFRTFPDLCIESAEEVIDRIRAIETKTWQYPRQSYRDLIDLSGRVIWDVIREDMGRTPMDNAPLSHLRFIEDEALGPSALGSRPITSVESSRLAS